MEGKEAATFGAGSSTGVGRRPPVGLADFISREAFNEFKTTKPQGPGTQKDTLIGEFPGT